MFQLRTILAVGRPAILPTIWSNCLAGWWLGGGGHMLQLTFLLVSATLLYAGGAFLNDAFDAEYDTRNHPERPVPSGKLAQQTVWRWGVALLVCGALLLLGCGIATAALGLVLVLFIVLHNTLHRLLPIAPLMEGLCRLLLYLIGAGVGERGVSGSAIWCGLALAGYIMGSGYFLREQTAGSRGSWPLLLLALPTGLALVMDAGPYRETGLLLSAVLLLWVVRCLRQTYWSTEPNAKKTLAGLLAGIVFVDWLATCPARFAIDASRAAQEISMAFLLLFGLTLLLQKLGPSR